MEYIGILDKKREPIFLSELFSKITGPIEGGEIDGLVLFNTVEEADSVMSDFDGIGQLCRIKLVIEELRDGDYFPYKP